MYTVTVLSNSAIAVCMAHVYQLLWITGVTLLLSHWQRSGGLLLTSTLHTYMYVVQSTLF